MSASREADVVGFFPTRKDNKSRSAKHPQIPDQYLFTHKFSVFWAFLYFYDHETKSLSCRHVLTAESHWKVELSIISASQCCRYDARVLGGLGLCVNEELYDQRISQQDHKSDLYHQTSKANF